MLKRAIEALFYNQVYRIENSKIPLNVLVDIFGYKDLIFDKAMELCKKNAFTGEVLFLPVIPFTVLELPQQIRLLEYKKNIGRSCFKSSNVVDLIKTPSRPYYIFNIKMNINNGLRNCQSNLTLAESINLCFHKNLLSRGYVKSLGSSLLGSSPIIHLYYREHPKVDMDYLSDDEDDLPVTWFYPSCSERLELRR